MDLSIYLRCLSKMTQENRAQSVSNGISPRSYQGSYQRSYRISAGIWFVIMLFVLFLPGSVTPSISPFFPHFDKVIHFGIFLVLTALLFMSIVTGPIKNTVKSASTNANTNMNKNAETAIDIADSQNEAPIERSQIQTQRRLFALFFVGVIIFAPLSEVIQAYWILGRSGDFADVVADLFGAVAGYYLVVTLRAYNGKHNR